MSASSLVPSQVGEQISVLPDQNICVSELSNNDQFHADVCEEYDDDDDDEEDIELEERQRDTSEEVYGGFSHLLRHRNLVDLNLPNTVTVLDLPASEHSHSIPGRLYLVGTAHFSLESQEDVRKTIRQTQPDLVMVELCNARLTVMFMDEDTILREAASLSFEKIMQNIKQSGILQGLMHILLLNMSAHITRQLGMAPGGEFRAAMREARQIPGCELFLGDRPIDITLQRAMASLSYWHRLRLAFYLLASRWQKISPEDVERCKRSDLMEEMLREMAGEFPALTRIFLDERDRFMTATLRRILYHAAHRRVEALQNLDESMQASYRQEPVVAVGIVGLGHVQGIQRYWNEEIDVKPLMQIPSVTRKQLLFRKAVKGAMLGLIVYATYRFGRMIYFRLH